jgi:RecA/RadA recombinase
MAKESDIYDQLVDQMLEGTGLKKASATNTLTACEYKVMTPFEVINCILGGGIPLSTVVHTYGKSKGGKSTWIYQMLGIFQKTYKNGLSFILDMESSADPTRLNALGVNTDKVVVIPAQSIESGFITLNNLLDKKMSNTKLKELPVFVIWDTISKGMASDDSKQSRVNAQDRARIIKNRLTELEIKIGRQPFLLCLLNQAVNRTDLYGHTTVVAGGGTALEHDMKFSIKVDPGKNEFDESKTMVTYRNSTFSLDKSKISPEIYHIPFKINVMEGGIIDTEESFLLYLIDCLKLIPTLPSGWYNFDVLIEKFKEFGNADIVSYLEKNNKKRRFEELKSFTQDSKTFYDILKIALCNYISARYSLQRVIIKPYLTSLEDGLKF